MKEISLQDFEFPLFSCVFLERCRIDNVISFFLDMNDYPDLLQLGTLDMLCQTMVCQPYIYILQYAIFSSVLL